MRDEARTKRAEEIEAAAYRLLEERGYDGLSMQAVAKAAKASNETLYRWYGDKLGLFSALIAGNTATVGAVLETDHSFFATRTTLFVAGNADLDLLLNGPFAKPGPVSVSFAANEAQSLQLADGTRIFIPAGAMPVTGMVTLHITPIATFAHQHHARLYKYGYAFIATDEQGTPIMANFDQNVVITFAYDEAALVALNLREEGLRPAYFSTTTNSWTIPDSYVVDTEANRVTMQIDHFTDFSLLGGSQVYEVMLPTIVR